MEPEIDIILPTFNRAQWLPEALASVVAQTYPHWKLWIVDDGSIDETPALLKDWQKKDSRIQSWSIGNRGVSGARNHGIRRTQAPWVALLDSDDQWLPDKLAQQVAYLQQHPDCPLIHTDEIWIRNGVRVNPMNKHKKHGGDIFVHCLPLCCISPSSVLFRRDLLQNVGLFREDFVVCEDYELWLRICSKYSVGYVAEKLVVKTGGHEDQLSRQFHSMDRYRILALEGLLLKGGLGSHQAQAAFKVLTQKAKILLKGCRKHQNLEGYDRIFKSTFLDF